MGLFEKIKDNAIKAIIAFVVVSLLLLLLKTTTIPEFIPSLTLTSIILTSISVVVATATYYRMHIKGPDITLKINENIELEPSTNTGFPALFINEGGKPGVLIRGLEWGFPSISLPEYLKDFGSIAEIKFDTTESHIKLAPGESVVCDINI